jgi:aspartyl protease family protein
MKKKHSFWLIFILIIVLGITGFVHLTIRFPDIVYGPDKINIVYGVLLLVFLCSTAIFNRQRVKLVIIIYGILAWTVFGFILFSAYSYRSELTQFGSKLFGELNPSKAIISSSGNVTIRANSSGQFVLEALVSGKGQLLPVKFLLDTGASDVVLSPRVFSRLGFDIEAIKFNRPYHTANGVVLGAPVRIDSINIGTISIDNVRASVNGAEMGLSLLGMSFLERLSSFDVKRGILTLEP